MADARYEWQIIFRKRGAGQRHGTLPGLPYIYHHISSAHGLLVCVLRKIIMSRQCSDE